MFRRGVLAQVAPLACFYLLTVCFAFSQIANVTDQTSTPIPGAGHDYFHMLTETVNPANGSVSLRIRVPVPKGRELTVPFSFAYDSDAASVLFSVSGQGNWRSNTTFLSQGGWSYGVPLLSADEISRTEGQYSCPLLIDYVFQDPSGARHALNLASVDYIANECSGDTSHDAGGDDVVRAALFGCGSTGLCEPVAVADPDGTTYDFNSPNAHGQSGGWGASLPYQIEDRNGNVVTVTDGNNGAFTYSDTAGRAAISSSGFGTSGNTVTVSGPGNPYTITWGSATANFNVGAVPAGPNTYCRGIDGEQHNVPGRHGNRAAQPREVHVLLRLRPAAGDHLSQRRLRTIHLELERPIGARVFS